MTKKSLGFVKLRAGNIKSEVDSMESRMILKIFSNHNESNNQSEQMPALLVDMAVQLPIRISVQFTFELARDIPSHFYHS